MLLLEQVLKKVVEKNLFWSQEFSSLFNFLHSRVLKCSGRAFCTLWFLFIKFCMLGREVLVCSVPSVMSMKFIVREFINLMECNCRPRSWLQSKSFSPWKLFCSYPVPSNLSWLAQPFPANLLRSYVDVLLRTVQYLLLFYAKDT